MAIKSTTGEKVFSVFNTILMLLVMLVTLYPFMYVALASISEPVALSRHNGLLLKPYGFHTDSYYYLFKNTPVLSAYKNTLIYMVSGTAINLIMTTLAAYLLSRKYIYWKKYIMVMIVITMFFSGGLIPKYLMIRSFGWINTIWPLIIPDAINSWNLMIMRTYFMGMPDSLEESAKIDGAGDLLVLAKIIIPLAMPVMAVMTLFYAVGHWNSWFSASIYLHDRDKFPLQLFLRELLIATSSDTMAAGAAADADRVPLEMTIRYAAIIVATVPVLLVYPYLQKYFVKGVMIGSLKG